MGVESPPRGEGSVPALAREVALQQLLYLLLGAWLGDVDGRVFEERGVEAEDVGFLLRGPRAEAEAEVDVGATEHGAEADGGGEDYEEENAE